MFKKKLLTALFIVISHVTYNNATSNDFLLVSNKGPLEIANTAQAISITADAITAILPLHSQMHDNSPLKKFISSNEKEILSTLTVLSLLARIIADASHEETFLLNPLLSFTRYKPIINTFISLGINSTLLFQAIKNTQALTDKKSQKLSKQQYTALIVAFIFRALGLAIMQESCHDLKTPWYDVVEMGTFLQQLSVYIQEYTTETNDFNKKMLIVAFITTLLNDLSAEYIARYYFDDLFNSIENQRYSDDELFELITNEKDDKGKLQFKALKAIREAKNNCREELREKVLAYSNVHKQPAPEDDRIKKSKESTNPTDWKETPIFDID